jgi:hypothetical protein
MPKYVSQTMQKRVSSSSQVMIKRFVYRENVAMQITMVITGNKNAITCSSKLSRCFNIFFIKALLQGTKDYVRRASRAAPDIELEDFFNYPAISVREFS